MSVTMWTVGLYNRGAQINPIHHPSMDDLTLHPWPDKVNSYGEDLSYATFRLMSRNEVHGTYKATEEEYLLEIIDQIKIALLKDLRDMRNRPVTALPGRQGFRGSVKRSRLGCYTGSSVWGRVKDSRGRGGRGLGVQGLKGFQGGSGVQGETLVDC